MTGRLLTWLALVALLAPLAVAAWVSFSPDSFLTPPGAEWSGRWYSAFARDRRWIGALVRGLLVALAAASLALLTATPLALAVARFAFRGRRLVAAAALAPLAFPPAALGLGALPGAYRLGVADSPLTLALIQALLALPVAFLILASHVRQLDPACELAARGLGAGAWQTFRRVTWPQLAPGVAAAFAAAFALSLNESVVSVFLSSPRTETLPAVVWPNLRYSPTPLVAVAAVAQVLAAGLALGVLRRWGRG